MMRNLTRVSALIAACIMLAACGGGGASGGAAPTVPTNSLKPASATFVVKIPAKSSAPAGSKRPAYITSNVQAIDFTAVSTTNASAGAYVFYPLTASSSYCTGTTGTGLTCTLAVAAPPGPDVITVNLYDAAESGQSLIVATGSVNATIAAQGSNTINITTSGVPNFAVIGSTNPYPPVGAAASVPLSLQVVDADGNIIVGSYDMPVTLTDSDTSGATSLSKTSLSQNSDAAGLTFNYTGSGSPSATINVNSTSPSLAHEQRSPLLASLVIAPGGIGPVADPAALYFPHTTTSAQLLVVIGKNGSAGPFSVSGCNGYATVTGTSPNFTVTPVASTFSTTAPYYNTIGSCQLTITDSSAHSATVPVMIGH